MTLPPRPSTHEATEIVRKAIKKHGRPSWVAHVPFRIRDCVSLETMRALVHESEDSVVRVFPKEGREAILEFCKNNVFALVTVKELSRFAGISEATVRNLIRERPDIFKKADWRSYEIRDPKADRAIDKRQANPQTINQQKRK